ncbi:MAG: NHL repeat-containing protein [Chloroflexi bacterium]|nr:NHL repeat-containing protein [Chloroflexota bacterium]MDA1145744.1 NHL repeat-containing protein [Chloroflexota bacterium]
MTQNGHQNGHTGDYEVLLRAGFPYVKTLGMRRLTWYPIDFARGDDGRIYCLSRFDGSGSIRAISFEDEDLGAVGPGFTWPASIVRDAAGRLYVSDEGTHQITVLTPEGEVVTRWGTRGSELGQLDRPSHMAFDAEERLWVSDTGNHRIQCFSKDGGYISSFGSHGNGAGQLDNPWGITFDAAGAVYVVDWRNDRVQKFTQSGELLTQFGSSGSGDGQFNRPAGIAIDHHGDIYVVDRGNNRVELFDRNGRYVEQFIGDATLSRMGRDYVLANPKVLRLRDMAHLEPQKRFRSPVSVHVDDAGQMIVGDYGSHRFQVYQKDALPLAASEVMAVPRSPSLSTV